MTTRTATKLTMVISGLPWEDSERAIVLLANGLARRRYRVTLLTFSDERTEFSLFQNVIRAPLGLTRAAETPFLELIPRTLRKLATLRAAVLASAPDVVIAHAPQVNVPTLFALRRSGLPVIVTEHGDVPARSWKNAVWYRLRRVCYPFAFRVVSVSKAVDCDVSWLPQGRRAVISDPIVAPVSHPTEPAPALLANGGDFILSMGPLSHAKGFDILIAAYAGIAADFPGWRLIILGDGALRLRLERQVHDLDLRERVLFAGAVANPSAYLHAAKLFVMASRYEGFPLAHGEALASGLPVIATDCPSRPLLQGERFAAGAVRELIRRSVDGVLVPTEDPAALARAMADLMTNDKRRNEFARHAADVVARFSPDRILDDWERLIQRAIATSLVVKRTAREDAVA